MPLQRNAPENALAHPCLPMPVEAGVFEGKRVLRSTTVKAIITKEMVGKKRSDFSKGSDKKPSPVWWTMFKDKNTGDWERGHLLGSQLGGPGGSAWQIMVPLHRDANASVTSGFEGDIRDAVEAGECIEFTATPQYVAPDTVTINER